MRYHANFLIILGFCLTGIITSEAASCLTQPGREIKVYHNQVSDSALRTILLYQAGKPLTLPLIELGTSEKLELHFDDLSADLRRFTYTLVHCDSRWEASPVSPQEYLSGYGSGRIENTMASFNTSRDYFHHSLEFPESDAIPVFSGNYALVVYEAGEPDNPVFIRQFYVRETRVSLKALIRQPAGEMDRTGQELEFTVSHEGYPVRDPVEELKIVIRQNQDPSTDKVVQKPDFIGPSELRYGGNNRLVFNGGNEFRFFDIKSMKYAAENIARIDFQNPYYHVFLKPDHPRTWDPYFTRQELNGEYFIDKEAATDHHTEADYVYVHFQMPAQIPYAEGQLFVYGGLTDWSVNNAFRLHYQPDQHAYVAGILLKQGFYNYAYAYCQENSAGADLSFLEGDHYETVNQYTLWVYHYASAWDYEKLIAVEQVPSH